jgi:hypothetical protein
VNLTFARIDADDDFHTNWSYSAGLGIYKELTSGVTVNLGGEIRILDYDDIAGEGRKDDRWSATVGLTKRDIDIFGYAPVLEYTYTFNNSNVALYEYDSHTIDFRLTKDF